jgi:hypothetical protein
MIHLFLTSLPLKEDNDEAYICHVGLCDMIENGSLDLRSTTNFMSVVQCVHKILDWVVGNNNTNRDSMLISRLQTIQTILQQSPNYNSTILNMVSPCSTTEYP